jgi:hypothetical protein
LACAPVANYIYAGTGTITDTIRNPTTGTIMSYTPSRVLGLTKSGDLLILSEFTGTLNYSDSLGAKSVSSKVGSQDLFLAKMHRCDSYNPAISEKGDTLICSIPGMAYQWYLNGTPLPGATSQTHMALSDGNYSVEIKDGWDCSSFSGTTAVTVGLRELAFGALKIFPNPAHEIITIDGIREPSLIQLSDITGRSLWMKQVTQSKISIDISELAKGIYILKIGSQSLLVHVQ